MSFNAGPWTDTEHNQFIEAVQLFDNKWRKLSLYIKTRSPSQIRSHAQKFILKIALKKKISFVNNNLERLKDKLDKVFPYRKDLHKTVFTFRNYLPKKIEDRSISCSEKSLDDKLQHTVQNFTLEGIQINKPKKIYENQYLSTQQVETFTIDGSFNNVIRYNIALLNQQISQVTKNLNILKELSKS